jgi:hypothetical protein
LSGRLEMIRFVESTEKIPRCKADILIVARQVQEDSVQKCSRKTSCAFTSLREWSRIAILGNSSNGLNGLKSDKKAEVEYLDNIMALGTRKDQPDSLSFENKLVFVTNIG